MAGPEFASKLLSVVVPVFNEKRTVADVLRRVVAAVPCAKEIIVVDDGSTDGTAEEISDFGFRISDWGRECGSTPPVILLRHERNLGKGAAVRTGLAMARGEVVIIQDADLEYDPAEYPRLVAPLVAGEADVVFGSRYLRRDERRELRVEGQRGRDSFFAAFRIRSFSERHGDRSLQPTRKKTPDPVSRCGVRLLNWVVRVLYGVRLTDEATCYKAFRRADLLRMELRCTGFEFCPEVTAKACRMGLRLVEVPISYSPRGRKEGKKIRWRDGVAAVRELWKWRKWRPQCESLGASRKARPQAPGLHGVQPFAPPDKITVGAGSGQRL